MSLAENARVRVNVLFGDFVSNDVASWQPPSARLEFILSSTFTDTHIERDCAMFKTIPKLRKAGRSYGIDIIAMDMRWGVRNENTDHHLTWIECSRVIERCRKSSAGVFFISLQAAKYGYCPVPKFVDKQLADQKFETISDPKENELVRKWFTLDENATPPRYVLSNLKSSDANGYLSEEDKQFNNEFWATWPTFLRILNGVPFNTDLCSGLLIGHSVTEWEARSALALEAKQSGDEAGLSRVAWFHRNFRDGISGEQDPRDYDPSWKDLDGGRPFFDDTRSSPDLQAKFNRLISDMESAFLGSPNLYTYDVASFEDFRAARDLTIRKKDFVIELVGRVLGSRVYDDKITCTGRQLFLCESVDDIRLYVGITDEGHAQAILDCDEMKKAKSGPWFEQLQRWESDFEGLLTRQLENCVATQSRWKADGCGIGIKGLEIEEMLHHYMWAREKVDTFIGRDDLVDKVMEAANIHSLSVPRQQDAVVVGSAVGGCRALACRVTSVHPLGCINAAVMGVSGAG
jgi:hypothetical protein